MHTQRFLRLAALAGLVALSGCSASDAPYAVLVAATVTGPPPLGVAFQISHTAHPRGRAMTFALHFGDGADVVTGGDFGAAIQHVYEDGGNYEAVLVVVDDRGRLATDRLSIVVDDTGPPVGVAVGETAPDFASLTTSGLPFQLSGARGSVVLLDFWGAWCFPCRASLPHLDELATSYADRGLTIVLISTDVEASDAAVFLSTMGFERFTSLWEPGGKAGSALAQLYGVSDPEIGIPRTYVIDRQGVIRYVGHPLDLLPEHVEALL